MTFGSLTCSSTTSRASPASKFWKDWLVWCQYVKCFIDNITGKSADDRNDNSTATTFKKVGDSIPTLKLVWSLNPEHVQARPGLSPLFFSFIFQIFVLLRCLDNQWQGCILQPVCSSDIPLPDEVWEIPSWRAHLQVPGGLHQHGHQLHEVWGDRSLLRRERTQHYSRLPGMKEEWEYSECKLSLRLFKVFKVYPCCPNLQVDAMKLREQDRIILYGGTNYSVTGTLTLCRW